MHYDYVNVFAFIIFPILIIATGDGISQRSSDPQQPRTPPLHSAYPPQANHHA